MSMSDLSKRQQDELIKALLDMCGQYMSRLNDDTLCNHKNMSAGEGAMDILVELGYAKEIDGQHFRIDYKDLSEY